MSSLNILLPSSVYIPSTSNTSKTSSKAPHTHIQCSSSTSVLLSQILDDTKPPTQEASKRFACQFQDGLVWLATIERCCMYGSQRGYNNNNDNNNNNNIKCSDRSTDGASYYCNVKYDTDHHIVGGVFNNMYNITSQVYLDIMDDIQLKELSKSSLSSSVTDCSQPLLGRSDYTTYNIPATTSEVKNDKINNKITTITSDKSPINNDWWNIIVRESSVEPKQANNNNINNNTEDTVTKSTNTALNTANMGLYRDNRVNHSGVTTLAVAIARGVLPSLIRHLTTSSSELISNKGDEVNNLDNNNNNKLENEKNDGLLCAIGHPCNGAVTPSIAAETSHHNNINNNNNKIIIYEAILLCISPMDYTMWNKRKIKIINDINSVLKQSQSYFSNYQELHRNGEILPNDELLTNNNINSNITNIMSSGRESEEKRGPCRQGDVSSSSAILNFFVSQIEIIVLQEVLFINLVLSKHCKIPEVWAHRLWLFEYLVKFGFNNNNTNININNYSEGKQLREKSQNTCIISEEIWNDVFVQLAEHILLSHSSIWIYQWCAEQHPRNYNIWQGFLLPACMKYLVINNNNNNNNNNKGDVNHNYCPLFPTDILSFPSKRRNNHYDSLPENEKTGEEILSLVENRSVNNKINNNNNNNNIIAIYKVMRDLILPLTTLTHDGTVPYGASNPKDVSCWIFAAAIVGASLMIIKNNNDHGKFNIAINNIKEEEEEEVSEGMETIRTSSVEGTTEDKHDVDVSTQIPVIHSLISLWWAKAITINTKAICTATLLAVSEESQYGGADKMLNNGAFRGDNLEFNNTITNNHNNNNTIISNTTGVVYPKPKIRRRCHADDDDEGNDSDVHYRNIGSTATKSHMHTHGLDGLWTIRRHLIKLLLLSRRIYNKTSPFVDILYGGWSVEDELKFVDVLQEVPRRRNGVVTSITIPNTVSISEGKRYGSAHKCQYGGNSNGSYSSDVLLLSAPYYAQYYAASYGLWLCEEML